MAKAKVKAKGKAKRVTVKRRPKRKAAAVVAPLLSIRADARAYWTPAGDRTLRVRQMDTQHLVNCVNYIGQRIERLLYMQREMGYELIYRGIGGKADA